MPVRASVSRLEHWASWSSQDWGWGSAVTWRRKTRKWPSFASGDAQAFIGTSGEAEGDARPWPLLPHLLLSRFLPVTPLRASALALASIQTCSLPVVPSPLPILSLGASAQRTQCGKAEACTEPGAACPPVSALQLGRESFLLPDTGGCYSECLGALAALAEVACHL